MLVQLRRSQIVGVIALCSASILTGCGSGAATSNETEQPAAETPAAKPLEGYAGIKFGSSFTEAVADHSGQLSSYALSECLKDLPIKGCFLSNGSDSSHFQIREGIPYYLNLSFNKFDKLTDIALVYDREGGISRSDCLSIHERTLDWLVREYGKLYAPSYDPDVKPQSTPAGNRYLISGSGKPDFVTMPMRTLSAQPTAAVLKKPITKWDRNRYVSLLSWYIVTDGEPHCRVTVDFSEPESVPRRVYEEPLETTVDEGTLTESPAESEPIDDL